jgi:hypothetical protein
MTTNRLFSGFNLLVILALVAAALLAIPLAVSTLHLAPSTVAIVGPGASDPNPISADQARFEFRRGEWFGGREDIYSSGKPVELEFQRYLWYHGQSSATAEPVVDPARDSWYLTK